MRENHLTGASPAREPFLFAPENIELMCRAKIKVVRMGAGFPFADECMEKLNDKYIALTKAVKKLKDIGIETLLSYECAGGSRYDPETGRVKTVRFTPGWVGGFDQDIFYQRTEAAAEFISRSLKDSVTWWQAANEPDIDSFIGDFTFEQNARYLQSIAKGVKKGNPGAKCGINLAGVGTMGGGDGTLGVHPYAKRLIETLYADDGFFDYIGLDGYFGSWSGGTPADWVPYIGEAAKVSGKPVFISEWGYSTIQRGEPRSEEDKKRNFNSIVCREKDWDAGGGAKWQGKDHNEEMQSGYIMECVKIFSEHPAVIGNLFFQWQDQVVCWQCGEPDCPAECGWGCLRADGTPKPGYFGLVEANEKYFD
jgi:hypothetical protein